MNINLTKREMHFLRQFAQKQYEGAEDNLGTKTPIHVVEYIEKQFVEDDSDEVWLNGDTGEEYNSFDDLIDGLREAGKDIPLYDNVEYETIDDVWINDEQAYCIAFGINAMSGRYIRRTRPLAFFLTLAEAKRYKNDYQAHNCEDCRIFTYGLGYSNEGDLPVFRALLMRMGQELLDLESEVK